MDYKKAGVDVKLGDRCSAIAYNESKKTFRNRKGKIGQAILCDGGFSGPIFFQELKNAIVVKNCDGVGSKAVAAWKMKKYDSLAFDLIAMVADDCAALGGEPIAATNTIDIGKVDENVISGLMKGIPKACERAGISMVGGEIAEMPDQVKGFAWNADLIGVLEKKKIVDGSRIRKGDSIVAFKSNGIRSNGLTLARRILEKNYGEKWHLKKFKGQRWGDILLKPSIIVSPAIVEMVGVYGEKGKCEAHGFAHITGGGIFGNFERIMKNPRLSAVFEDLWEPNPEFLEMVRLGNVPKQDAFRSWNMGNCFLVVTPEPNKAIEIAEKHGIRAKEAGRIVG
ncbi:MAG: phosphoribosylformylglycinamidine cyclo-ligase [Candidatus Diapherotrites archaeon]